LRGVFDLLGYIGNLRLRERSRPFRLQPLNVAEASAIVPRRFKSRTRCGIRLARDANLSVTPALYKPVVLINTSGTTGLPKFVIHTPEILSELADFIVKDWGFSVTDVTR
jgi:long-subunit acyl-CoA synthetase (AMP-forming)